MQGEVAVGVRLALPIEGVHFILGNGLAGNHIWADVPPSSVTLCPVNTVSLGAPVRCLRFFQPVWLHA